MAEVDRPIAKHHPITRRVPARKTMVNAAIVPDLNPAQELHAEDELEEWALEVYEWLSLVGIQSPRVLAGDTIDPYLSRYKHQLPQSDSSKPQDLARITWFGLLPPQWVRKLFVNLRYARTHLKRSLTEVCSVHSTELGARSKERDAFFSLSAHAFLTKPMEQQEGYTVLYLSKGRRKNDREAVSQEDSPEKKGVDQAEDRFVLWEIF